MHGFFVTGTDTGVGKTEVSCALIHNLQRAGYTAVGMKPVAAGARRSGGKLRNADVEALDRVSHTRASRAQRNPYLLAPPIAPHIAAREAGIDLDIRVMADACRSLARRADVVVVEGAGGLLVPLGARGDMRELARSLALPIVVVVGMRLGCISHALLTIEALESRGLAIAGWVANRIDPKMRRYSENVATLVERIRAPLLAGMPCVEGRGARRRVMSGLLDVSLLSPWLPHRSET